MSRNGGKLGFICKICKKRFYVSKSIIKADRKRGINAGKFCSRECFYKSPERSPNKGKFGKDSFGWGGGIVNERGYVLRIVKNHPYGVKMAMKDGKKYVREHRLVMEKHIGRYLKPSENIHHINGIKWDNRLENLKIFKKSEHGRHHLGRLWSGEHKCPKCGFEFKDKIRKEK